MPGFYSASRHHSYRPVKQPKPVSDQNNMKKLSTGANSTLGEYRKLTCAVFGTDSKATAFIDQKIKDSPNGEKEEVLADEGQMAHLLMPLR